MPSHYSKNTCLMISCSVNPTVSSYSANCSWTWTWCWNYKADANPWEIVCWSFNLPNKLAGDHWLRLFDPIQNNYLSLFCVNSHNRNYIIFYILSYYSCTQRSSCKLNTTQLYRQNYKNYTNELNLFHEMFFVIWINLKIQKLWPHQRQAAHRDPHWYGLAHPPWNPWSFFR